MSAIDIKPSGSHENSGRNRGKIVELLSSSWGTLWEDSWELSEELWGERTSSATDLQNRELRLGSSYSSTHVGYPSIFDSIGDVRPRRNAAVYADLRARAFASRECGRFRRSWQRLRGLTRRWLSALRKRVHTC